MTMVWLRSRSGGGPARGAVGRLRSATSTPQRVPAAVRLGVPCIAASVRAGSVLVVMRIAPGAGAAPRCGSAGRLAGSGAGLMMSRNGPVDYLPGHEIHVYARFLWKG